VFDWTIPPEHPVSVYGSALSPARLQIFEAAVATVMASVHPDYTWQVTREGRDAGLDFVGRQLFLDDSALGIAAAITVGGQCKKRTHVRDVVGVIGPSLTRMADAINPTFFIVALSARVTQKRIKDAQRMLEKTHQRHCHILDRAQVEGLLSDHLTEIEDILHQGLDPVDFDAVVRYLLGREGTAAVTIDVAAPERVLSGVPFSIDVSVRSTLVARSGARLWWVPDVDDEGSPAPVDLIVPVAAGSPAGETLSAVVGDDPFLVRLTFEMISYAVGQVDLGQLVAGNERALPSSLLERESLGVVQVIDNVRPRFFDRPVRGGLIRLEDAFDRARTGAVVTASVLGAGGSGKSRLCAEFALGKRRHGAGVVTVRQAKTHDDPYGIFAQLALALAESSFAVGDDPADVVVRSIACFDPSLAAKVDPTVRSLLDSGGLKAESMVEQSLLSALLVLIVARARRMPLIVHLQDLHWCTTAVLTLLERLLWQLEQVLAKQGSPRPEGVLVLLEGRIRESGSIGLEAWSSAPFESFVDRIGDEQIICAAFDSRDGLDFVRLLFEQRHSAKRLISDHLLPLQDGLIEQVYRVAGGNPFHSLAQVQLLRERGVLGRNPATGLHYLIRPEPEHTTLPDSVFEAIRRRWQDTRVRDPQLALLMWGCALLDDRLPDGLFRRLWAELAPETSRQEIDATDALWTGDGRQTEVAFRHENYFHALRAFEVPPDQRARVVNIYDEWFATLSRPGPAERFRWARALREAPEPNLRRVRSLLNSALRTAGRQGDKALARRISAAVLDLTWAEDAHSPLPLSRFVMYCDQELNLLCELIDADRPEAVRRLSPFLERIRRHTSAEGLPRRGFLEVDRRRLAADIVHAQYLFNDQQPDRSGEVAAAVVRNIALARSEIPPEASADWDQLEMEALHTQAVAIAIGGEIQPAIPLSAAAVQIARRVRSGRAHQVIGTHGNILLGTDPESGVALLRDCLADAPDDAGDVDRVEIHLGIGLAILAHRCDVDEDARRVALLQEARERLTRVVGACFRVGLHSDAGAAALMLGIISALEASRDSVSWFAQAVAASARGQQLETLWKAHINLALALHAEHGLVTHQVSDHARAALELMEQSLSVSTHPDRTPRFGLLRTSLVQAVSLLVQAGDSAGREALERHPALRSNFDDPDAGIRSAGRAPDLTDHQWTLRIGEDDYVLY
jgi:hypothetical protein